MGQGAVCGAITGASILLGYVCQGWPDEQAARYSAYDQVAELMARFEARHGSVVCRVLLDGIDLATDEGREEAERSGLFHTRCPVFLATAAEILAQLLEAGGGAFVPPTTTRPGTA